MRMNVSGLEKRTVHSEEGEYGTKECKTYVLAFSRKK